MARRSLPPSTLLRCFSVLTTIQRWPHREAQGSHFLRPVVGPNILRFTGQLRTSWQYTQKTGPGRGTARWPSDGDGARSQINVRLGRGGSILGVCWLLLLLVLRPDRPESRGWGLYGYLDKTGLLL